jgi:hypothetical protein
VLAGTLTRAFLNTVPVLRRAQQRFVQNPIKRAVIAPTKPKIIPTNLWVVKKALNRLAKESGFFCMVPFSM